jgi:hypothetical protein
MELDHNLMIHQQAKARSQREEEAHLRNVIQAYHIRKDIYKRVHSLLTSSQAKHKLEVHYNKRD